MTELTSTLQELEAFVYAEHQAEQARLEEIWQKPLNEKLLKGETQHIQRVERVNSNHLNLHLGENESRFREGDMLCLHLGDAISERVFTKACIASEDDNQWLLRLDFDACKLDSVRKGCYVDPDGMNLLPFYKKAFDDISSSQRGRNILLPLMAGTLDTDCLDEDRFDDAADYAEECGLNEKQCDAVGRGVAAKYLACIQGPPGTGKTKVISVIAKLLVAQGQKVLMTSHTHMAINNALNKIAQAAVPVAKIGGMGSTKALSEEVARFEYASKWEDAPDSGYVIGATPFSTCNERLDQFEFDTVIFDEASQITMPLALMAMRKGKRFIFVGDHKQLPPVILSESVLDKCSAFAKMIFANCDVLTTLLYTYRMSPALTRWPSDTYYHGKLVSMRPAEKSRFALPHPPARHTEVLSSDHPAVFVKTPGRDARSVNKKEAQWVADLIVSTVEAGLSAEEIGVVTPFRSHARALKACLSDKLGTFAAQRIVTDTVERMQGQEREMIIMSLCSSCPQYISAIAAFFFQPERLNVAITRPQTKLVVVGPDVDDSIRNNVEDQQVKTNIDDYRSLIKHCYRVEY